MYAVLHTKVAFCIVGKCVVRLLRKDIRVEKAIINKFVIDSMCLYYKYQQLFLSSHKNNDIQLCKCQKIMSEYENVRKGKLILKGENRKAKKRKHKDKIKTKECPKIIDKDAISNGGWWKTSKVDEITGSVAIEFGNRTYVKALDNGLFTLGAPHNEGEGPLPEEIFTAIKINENKVAFKSGYGKYLKIEKDGMVTGRSDAVGAMEQWEPIFENEKMAILAETGCFMAIDPEDDALVALRKKVGEAEIAVIRSSNTKEDEVIEDDPNEEKGDLSQVEINYVKKFQKFQDKKLRLNTSDVKELESAKIEGNLHEKLLDRRSKMKADRYCK